MSKKKNITVLKEFRPLTKEELATELTPQLPKKIVPFRGKVKEDIHGEQSSKESGQYSGTAVIGIVLSILSLFFLPYILAPIGIVLGYLAYRRGDQGLGIWAMGLGVIGLLGTLIVSTFVY
ncbi:DUF308 domain-containing protein [Tepidibacillus infernus]|uniref:DUF4190 domain-containing protein n=1 Tax=Tepidibacillus decaturensis TaxID=1413211 RepID=A0A135L2U5_9BACI|nr:MULTISPECIES: DUF4190 domain-containing protein [Tepidibacillus]KXG43217.1 hypothetical protein U473_03700 [Tepidibacillus decaturensis]GBF10959.1 hypothetical protein HK1_00975 [Tepidibacillus sp. HK-1]